MVLKGRMIPWTRIAWILYEFNGMAQVIPKLMISFKFISQAKSES